ncbi:MAG: Ig-like domain-containing protein, partial [Planctomycetota bacterium]
MTLAGNVTYDPSTAAGIQNLAEGQLADDTFTYTLTDTNGAMSAPVTVTIALIGRNDPPVAVADAFSVAADPVPMPTGQKVRLDVLGNDRDAEGDPLALTLDRTGTLGTAVVVFDAVTGRQAVDYTLPPQLNLLPGQQLVDSFRYTASDGHPGGQSTTTVNITISGPNRPPVANNDSATGLADSTVSIAVLANDSDPDPGQTLSVIQINGAAITPGSTASVGTRGATVTLTSSNTIIFSPNGGYDELGLEDTATETFTYRVSDNFGAVDDALVTVQIGGKNRPPIGVDDGYVAFRGATFATSDPDGTRTPTVSNDDGVLANDTDPNPSDRTSLKARINIPPQHASLFTLNTNGTFVYRHDGSNTFQDTFFYVVEDAHGATQTAQVIITITEDLTPRPWRNSIEPRDVNNDGFITPLDALIVINSLNLMGTRPLPNPPVPPNSPPPFYDTNGDGTISPVDVLLIINYLNDPANQSEGEGEGSPRMTESLVDANHDFVSTMPTSLNPGLGYGQALASYILQQEDADLTAPLRSRLSSLAERTSVSVDAYRMAYESALATADVDQIDFTATDV